MQLPCYRGQVPGLRVVNGSGQSGNNKVSLRVRGQGTYSDAGSDPLVLINGVPGDLSNLDPECDRKHIGIERCRFCCCIWCACG